MRPRSALRRPPSAMRHSTSTEQAAHRFTHALREKISIHRHAMNLPDAPRASPDAAQLSGETDAEFFSVLRNREDALRTRMHRIALDDDFDLSAPPVGDDSGTSNLVTVPPLALGRAGCVARAVDASTVVLESWMDEDEVVVSDEPRILRILGIYDGHHRNHPCGSTTSAVAATVARDATPHWRRFAIGSLVVSAFGAAGILHTTHDSAHGCGIHTLGQNDCGNIVDRRRAGVPSLSNNSDDRGDNGAYLVVASMPHYVSKAASLTRRPQPMSLAQHATSATSMGDVKHLHMVLEPFSDAEIFQWFYWQLVLRAHVGAFLDPSVFTYRDAVTGQQRLRGDLIARRALPHQALAFAVPDTPQQSPLLEFIAFPSKSSLLSIVALEGIVLPLSLTTSAVPAEVPCDELLGWRDIPSIGPFGRYVLTSWAPNVRLRTPADALAALVALFDVFAREYHATRSLLMDSRVVPQVFRCGARASRRLKRFPWLTHIVCSHHHFLAAAASPAEHAVQRPASPPGVPSTTVREVTSATDGNNESSTGTTATGNLPAPPPPKPPPPVPLAVLSAAHCRVQEECGYLLDRWKAYIGHPAAAEVGLGGRRGDVTLFEGHDAAYLDRVKILGTLGRGGSGLVFKAEVQHPVYEVPILVAVKCFVFPDGMEHEQYVRESLTDVSFFALFSEVDAHAVCPSARIYDFFVTADRLHGMQEDDWRSCVHNQVAFDSETGHPATRLCYLVSELVDGVVGRFLRPDEDDYDVSYDTLVNKPLDDLQAFLLLYSQLILRSQFEYTIHDLILNGQLRGDNLGLISVQRLVAKEKRRRTRLPGTLGIVDASAARFVWFQYTSRRLNKMQYVKFPLESTSSSGAHYIVYIDVGQGVYDQVQALHDQGLIGCPTVESCLVDDGMGRFWEPSRLYAKDIGASQATGQAALAWAAGLEVVSQSDAVEALNELLERFADAGYAAREDEQPSVVDIADRLVWTCTEEALEYLRHTCTYTTTM